MTRALLTMVLVVACDGPTGVDAGSVLDAAPLEDATTTVDAGGRDAGPAQLDAAVGEDAGAGAPIEGRLVDGEEIVVRGAGFPEREHARPLIWADFEEGTDPTPLGRLTRWDDFGGELTDAVVAPSSRHAVRYDHGAGSGAAGGRVRFDSERLYVFAKRYHDFDITDSAAWGPRGFNHKTIRLWNRCGAACDYRQNNLYFGYQGMEGGNPRVVAEYTNAGTLWEGPPPQPRRWMQEEWLYRSSRVDMEDGVFDYVLDGVAQWEHRFRNRTPDYPGRYDYLVFDQVSNGTGPGSHFSYHDDVYVDTTWTRAMITDAPTLAESRIREIQIPIAWSATEIRLRVRRGAHPSFDGRYLLVIGEDGGEQAFPL